MKGLIIKAISGEYTVKVDDRMIICKPLGIFRHQQVTPKVGDTVEVEGQTITEIYKRKNDLIRPCVANIDKVFIVTSLVEPTLNLNLLDRLISMVEWENMQIVLVFTKVDLTDVSLYQKTIDYYRALNYPVYLLPGDNQKIIGEINDNVGVVAGQSGVGKSSMINTLDDRFAIKTDAISYALGRGKHTTRHIELLPVGSGWIADTPGFGTLDLNMDPLSLSHTFVEFFATKCKFSKCLHLNEPGCMVKEKVNNGEFLKSRYDNYLSFISEINNKKKY